jgi:hypothetical protein
LVDLLLGLVAVLGGLDVDRRRREPVARQQVAAKDPSAFDVRRRNDDVLDVLGPILVDDLPDSLR